MKKILAVLLSTSIMFGSGAPANAYEHDRHDRDERPAPVVRRDHRDFARDYQDRDDHKHRHHHNNNGWGFALGILGVGAALAIANDSQQVYADPQPVYVQPQPVYVQPQPVYVQRTYVPVTVAQTVYEPRTVYKTVYQPQYTQVSQFDDYDY